MKKALMIFLAAASSLCIAAQSQTEAYVKRTSEKLPKEVSDGLVWQTVSFNPEAKTLTFSMNVDAQVVPFDALKSSADILKEGKVAELMTGTDDDTKAIYDTCAKDGNTLVYIFSDGAENSFEMKITPADFK